MAVWLHLEELHISPPWLANQGVLTSGWELAKTKLWKKLGKMLVYYIIIFDCI